MMIAIDEQNWAPFQELPSDQLGSILVDLAGNVQLAAFRRHPCGPKEPVPKRTRYLKHSHVSTSSILAKAARKKSP